MAVANRTWGEERIAAELLVKLGIRVSPRTVRRYLPSGTGSKRGPGSQAWSTFVRNHARSMLACDFFVAVTVGFRVLYIFVVLEVGTRRILHWNVTDHPPAAWTAQQFRMVVSGDEPHRFVVHDHDSIYSEGVDRTIAAMGLTVVKTPVRVPQGNAFCERLIGTIRRECLDCVMPLHERHLRSVLAEWVGTTIAAARTRVWGRASPIRPTIGSRHRPAAIGSATATVSSPNRCSAACTMNIVLNRWPHDPTSEHVDRSCGAQAWEPPIVHCS